MMVFLNMWTVEECFSETENLHFKNDGREIYKSKNLEMLIVGTDNKEKQHFQIVIKSPLEI